MQSLLVENDSANTFYNIRLWPKGALSFSAAEGFSGEFDSVQMTGFLNKITHKTDHLQL